MIKTLLSVALQMIVAAARITIMLAMAAITLAGRLMATAIGAYWRRRHPPTSGRAEPESINPSSRSLAPEPRARASQPRPFKF